MELIRKFYDYYGDSAGGYTDQNGNPIDPAYLQQLQSQANKSLWGGVASGALSGASAGSVVPGWGTLIGGVVGAGVGLFTGESQKKKAQSLLNQARPNQQVPQAILQNQQIAQNQALQGLPSEQYQQAMKNIQRQTNQAVSSAQSRNAGIGLIGATQQNQADATGALDAKNAQARLENIKQLMGVNNTVGNYQQQAFDWNQKQKYLQNYEYGMSLLGAGNQNIVGGIDKGVAGLMRSGALNGLFGKKTTTTTGINQLLPSTGNYLNPVTARPDIMGLPSAGENSIVPQAATNVNSNGTNDLGAMDYELMNN